MEQNIEQQVTRGLGGFQQQGQKSYPFPTEIISLPSKGLVYPESSPLSKGEITIKLMTAKEEDILTSTNLIRKGLHLDKLLESVVIEPGVNIGDLLIGDKNAILITSKEIDETLLNRNNEYDFILPISKTPIKFKLLTHGDEIIINKDIEAAEKTLKQSNEITARYRKIITEVNGSKDVGTISNFVVNQLRAGDSKALRAHMSKITPDLDLTFDYTYPVSGEVEALRIPFGTDFFYPAD